MENSEEEYDIDRVHQTISNTTIELSQMFWDVPREVQLEKINEGWSALEILIHLRQVSTVYAERTKRVMSKEGEELVFLKDYDENKLIARVNLDEETAKANLNSFMQSRSKLLNLVSLIAKEEWEVVRANHEVEGTQNLLQMLTPLAKREENYLNVLREKLKDYI